MKRSRFTEDQIIGILKEHEAGVSVADLCRKHGVSDATVYKWKAKYGGMDVSEAKRLKGLEDENARLKRLLAATVTRKAFTNEAMLERLDRELHHERERIDKQRADDRKADADRLERIETDIRAMRDVMFEAFQRGRTD